MQGSTVAADYGAAAEKLGGTVYWNAARRAAEHEAMTQQQPGDCGHLYDTGWRYLKKR